jgi:hypothetical protein
MKLSKERIQEMKDLLEKKEKREFTWEEASDVAYRLAGLAEICFEHYKKELEWKKKLEESPKGFLLEGGYSCIICGQGGSHNGGIWHDKFGHKCMICQKAVDRKEIPASVASNEKIWYSKYDMEGRFNLKGPTLRSWIKKGILKARTITYNGKGVHMQLFLIKDNKDTLPPKKLTESHMVSEEKDGQKWYHSEPWYKFGDPYKILKGYKIMDYLRVTHGEKDEKNKS